MRRRNSLLAVSALSLTLYGLTFAATPTTKPTTMPGGPKGPPPTSMPGGPPPTTKPTTMPGHMGPPPTTKPTTLPTTKPSGNPPTTKPSGMPPAPPPKKNRQ